MSLVEFFLLLFVTSFANAARVDVVSPSGIQYFGDDVTTYTYHGGRDFCNSQEATLARPRTVQEFHWLVHELNSWSAFWIDGKEETTDLKYILQNGERFPLATGLTWYERIANQKTRCADACCAIVAWTPLARELIFSLASEPCTNSRKIVCEIRNETQISTNQKILQLQSELSQLRYKINVMQVENERNKVLKTPFGERLPLPFGIRNLGTRIHISGKPLSRFTITIHSKSNHENEDSNVPLKIDVNFTENVVLRNAKVNGDSTTPERYGGFPFKVNHFFDIVIRVDPERFYIRINGQDFASFDHRVHDLEGIYTMLVEGAVTNVVTSLY